MQLTRPAELQTALAQMSTKSSAPAAPAPAEPPVHHAHVTPSATVYTDSQATWTGMNWMQHASTPAPSHPLAQSHTASHIVLETTPPLVVPPSVLEQTAPPVPEQPGPAPPQPASEPVYGHPIELQRVLPTSMPGMNIDLGIHAVPPVGAPPSSFAQAYASDTEAGSVGGPLLDILWPGWPPRLPTPTMLDHLWVTYQLVSLTVVTASRRSSTLSPLSRASSTASRSYRVCRCHRRIPTSRTRLSCTPSALSLRDTARPSRCARLKSRSSLSTMSSVASMGNINLHT